MCLNDAFFLLVQLTVFFLREYLLFNNFFIQNISEASYFTPLKLENLYEIKVATEHLNGIKRKIAKSDERTHYYIYVDNFEPIALFFCRARAHTHAHTE